MSSHLPECSYSPGQPGFGGINSGIDSTQPFIPGQPCICDRLRACKQRVLNAAREAVAALDYPHIGSSVVVEVKVALAVIDALKEKP